METSARQEGRRRASRSSREESNKENICPLLQARLLATEMGRRRSPLPAGFPRSPLQDITDVVYPPHVRPDRDPYTGQVHKKCKKETFTEFCAQNDHQSDCASLKGLKACAQSRFQAEHVTPEKLDSIQILPTLMESCSEGSLVELSLCIHRDSPESSALVAPISERHSVNWESELTCIEGGRMASQAQTLEQTEDAKVNNSLKSLQNDGETLEELVEGERILANGHFSDQAEEGKVGKANLIEQSENQNARSLADSRKNKDRPSWKVVVKEGNCKRQEQTVQAKKRSTLSMLR